MKKSLFYVLGLIFVMVIVVFFTLGRLKSPMFSFGFFSTNAVSAPQESTQAPIIRAAKAQYSKSVTQHIDFNQSPCLASDLGMGYALQIVHEPQIDSDHINVCPSYKSGNTQGIVQILPDGVISSIQHK